MNSLDAINEIFRPIFEYNVFKEVKTQPHQYDPAAPVNMPGVKQVIFNREATIVYFNDGTKCIVRKSAQDTYNREHAVVYAIVKRAYGTVDEDGVVQGNGMGTMLAKLVKNGYDQEAYQEKQKEHKNAKAKFVGDDDHVKAGIAVPTVERVKPWTVSQQKRDSKGRFAKKANRK